MLPSLQRLHGPHGLRRLSLEPAQPTGVAYADIIDVKTLQEATVKDGALVEGATYLATRHSSKYGWVQIVFTCLEAYQVDTQESEGNKIKVASVASSKDGECTYRDRIARAEGASKDFYFLHGAFWVKGPDDDTIHDFFNAHGVFRWTLYRMA